MITIGKILFRLRQNSSDWIRRIKTKNNFIIGTRSSKLALIQADSIATQIKELYPDCGVSIRKVVTKGDHDRHTSLDRMRSSGIFVKELEEDLLNGRIDLAVHSLKDVPTQLPRGLCLSAVTERLDPRDVLVCRASSLAELHPHSKIGTGSLRRAAQLARYRPDLEIRSIRGNVDTRIHKVACGEIDGVILAAAAMLRLGWQDRITEFLPLEHFLPAVGQGTLAIEVRLDDERLLEITSMLNHIPTWQCISAERAFLSSLGGGCRTPIAALATINGDALQITGMVTDISGEKMLHASEEGDTKIAEKVGIRLAQKMMALGVSEFLTEVKTR